MASEGSNKIMSHIKRSQITVFMVLGIFFIILIAVSIYLYSGRFSAGESLVMPQEILPAKNYIEYCVDDSFYSALYLLGMQGGYINIPPEVQSNPARYLSFGNGAVVMPYWYFDNRNYFPSTGFMEKELTLQVNSRFMECMKYFNLYVSGLEMKSLADNSTTRISINAKDITLQIDYPVEVSNLLGTRKTRMSRYSRQYDVRLKDMIELAKAVLNYENRWSFVENITIGLMAMDAKVPFTGMAMGCNMPPWHISDIKKEVQSTLMQMMPSIRVENTDYYPFDTSEDNYIGMQYDARELKNSLESIPLFDDYGKFEGDYRGYEKQVNSLFDDFAKKHNFAGDSYLYNNMLMPMAGDEAYKNMQVDFMYKPSFGMDIQANPSSDGVLKPSMVQAPQQFLSLLCMNIYHFTYDLNYPITISINDPDALNRRGFRFTFAIPILIRDNEGRRSSQYIEYRQDSDSADGYCISQGSGKGTIFKAYDNAEPQYALDNTSIYSVCANRKCRLGVTSKLSGTAGISFLRANMTDACSNPYIVAEKEGYISGRKLISENSGLVEIGMTKKKRFPITLLRHGLSADGKTISLASEVAAGTATIYMSGFIGGSFYEASSFYEPGKDNYIELPATDADYDVSITYMKNGEDFSGGYYSKFNASGELLAQGNSIRMHFVEMIMPVSDEDSAKAIGNLESMKDKRLSPEII